MMIGIAGKAASGKDSTAEYLASQMSYSICHFADEMKRSVHSIFGMEHVTRENKEKIDHYVVWDKIYRQEMKRLGFKSSEMINNFFYVFKDYIYSWNDASVDMNISPRLAYQKFGTELCRAEDCDVWVKQTDKTIHSPDTTIIADVRFANEAEYIVQNGGIIILVENERVQPVASHVSESPLDDDYVDYVIKNNGTFEELYAQLDEILGEIDGD